MPLKFQYNKIAMQQLQKQLRVRENALPTLIAKESALRLEVKKARAEVARIKEALARKNELASSTFRLWSEFRKGIVSIEDVKLLLKKIAGVKTPEFKAAEFSLKDFSLVNLPSWIPAGIEILKEISELEVKKRIAQKKAEILERARKKTTQKVNLYEKVQIPEYREAILKIKRFLEDDENLSKSAQKILKARIALAEVSR